MTDDIDKLLENLRRRYQELVPGTCSQKDFVAHLRNLALWEKSWEYPEVDDDKVVFDKEIHIAFAVCTKECGHAEFIVDGSTQECQYCGASMFRTVVKKYVLGDDS